MDTFIDYVFSLPTWLGCGTFTMWACIRQHVREHGAVKRRDLAFFLFLAAAGPLGLGAAMAAIISLPDGFWEKRVWPPKQEWKSPLLRDNGRRPEGRDVKQARGASPPEWAVRHRPNGGK